MNILDENIPENVRPRLSSWRVRFRQIGREVGRTGMQDADIIRLLQSFGTATFFTRDADYSVPRLCHPAYCLVYLKVDDGEFAKFVRRVLRHPRLNSRAKRMGAVIHVSRAGLRIWRRHAEELTLEWA
jgi:hypothetical protein